MRVLYLVPQRAVEDPNTTQIVGTLVAAGHSVGIIGPLGRTRVGGILNLMYRAPRIAEKSKPDVILCRDLDTLAAGVRAKRRTGAKLVYWAHDVYQHMVQGDVPRPLVAYLDRHERGLLPPVDAAIVANEGVRAHLMERCLGLFPALVMLCRVPEVYFPPLMERRLGYFGTLHKNRFIREMVEAMPAIREGFDDPKPTLTIAGPRTNDLYDWVESQADGEAVTFLGHIDADEVLHKTYESDIIVTMLNPADRCLRAGLANKVFDAMAVGRAAIGTRGTATGDLIAETGMGVVCDYDPDVYVSVARMLLRMPEPGTMMGKNAYYAGKTKYNWNLEAAKLVKVFEELG